MLFGFIAPVDQVEVAILERGEELGNLFGRILKIVVHGDDDSAARMAEAAHQSVMLTVVAHQLNRRDPIGVVDLDLF